MKKKDILRFTLKFLEVENKIPKIYKDKINSFEYLHMGHIDSLNLIHFIYRLEKKFKIKFSSKEKESSDFRTVGGLANMINKKIK